MLVLTWNIKKHVRAIDAVTSAVTSKRPDIVTLQEVAEAALPPLRDALGAVGLNHVVTTMARKKGNAIFSRWPLRPHRDGWAGELPFPELLTGAVVDSPAGAIELVTAHMPNGAGNGEKKVAHFRALARHLAKRAKTPRLVTGDFNSPRSEAADGTVLCFGGDYKNRGPVWERAEQAIITGMATFGMRDVFRERHGYKGDVGRDAYSHVTAGKKRRLDHIFASKELKVDDVRYEMKWLEDKRSDHAALLARFV